jgi:chitinase
MTPSKDHQLPSRLVKKLEKRGVTEPAVFDFTFDYDWTPIVKRGDPNKRIRIDYSDDPGYWASIVAAKPGTKRSDHEREMYEEVARVSVSCSRIPRSSFEANEMCLPMFQDHGGSWESYLDHKWSLDRRNTPEDKLHELHDRWISAIVGDWYNRMKKVDVEYEFARHKVSVRASPALERNRQSHQGLTVFFTILG